MYPNLYYLLKSWFGVDLPLARIVNMFGFFVAIAFFAGAWVMTRELKRKEAAGLFQPTEEMIIVGNPATWTELITNFVIGFLFGYKIIGFFVLGATAYDDPQAYILSMAGNFWGCSPWSFPGLPEMEGKAQTGTAQARGTEGAHLSA